MADKQSTLSSLANSDDLRSGHSLHRLLSHPIAISLRLLASRDILSPFSYRTRPETPHPPSCRSPPIPILAPFCHATLCCLGLAFDPLSPLFDMFVCMASISSFSFPGHLTIPL